MDGWWDCDALDEMVCRAQRSEIARRLVAPATGAARRPRQARSTGSRGVAPSRSVRRHYDIGNDLYRCMLDARMIYSCGYWRDGRRHSTTRRRPSSRLIKDKLQLEPGMRVLDIGCGWGGAARFLAEQAGCDVVGSPCRASRPTGARELRRTADRDPPAGLPRARRAVRPRLLDRDVRARRRQELRHLLRRRAALPRRPPGDLAVCTRSVDCDRAVADRSMDRAVHLPQLDAAVDAADLGRPPRIRFVIEDLAQLRGRLRPHADGLARQHRAQLEHLSERYDDRFQRMWDWYLLSSAGSFRARNLQLWQTRDVAGGYRRGLPARRRPLTYVR